MNNKFLWLSILAVILSFFGGFMLANALNRSEMGKIQSGKTQPEKQASNEQTSQKELNLSNDEIETKIKESEDDPNNFAFQKGLGLGLYQYAGMKQDKSLLAKIAPILERANKLNPNDYEVLVSIGNLHYDLGQMNKDPNSNLKAREYYKQALLKNEKDANVRTDYALTFLLTENADKENAIKEFEKALKVNPNQEKALTFMTQAQIEVDNIKKANTYLARLKKVNSENIQISELENSISQKSK